MKNQIYPTFIQSGESHIFVALNGDISEHAVLVVPALFEEHNYSMSVLNNTLHESGAFYARFDYFGCGDSEGEISEASISMWLKNIIDVGNYLIGRGVERITLLGVRFGALLLLANQRYLHEQLPIVNQVVWKPILSGKAQVNQLSRLYNSNLLSANDQHDNWLTQVASGEIVFVGGYPISNGLINSIESLQIDKHQSPASPLHWLELGMEKLSVTTDDYRSHWPSAQFVPVKCQRFWQVPEIQKEPTLESIHRELFSIAI